MASAGLDATKTIPLDLEGQLDLEFNSERLALVARGNTAVLTLPSVRCGWNIYRSLPGSRLIKRLVHQIETFAEMDLRLDVAIGTRVLVSAGAGHPPSRFLRTLGLPPVKVHWSGLAWSLMRL